MRGGIFFKLLGAIVFGVIALSLLNKWLPEGADLTDSVLLHLKNTPLTFDGWPDWIQALMSAIAVMLSLIGIFSAPDPRAILDVEFVTRAYNPAGLAKSWQINLIARRDITEDLNLHIYPFAAGNEIVSLVVVHADGGVSPTARIDDMCDAHVVIKRMPARAGCSLVLNVKKADRLSILSVGKRINKKAIYQRIETGGYVRAQHLGGLTAVAHHRAMLLLILFIAYGAIIILRLVFIGLFPQGI